MQYKQYKHVHVVVAYCAKYIETPFIRTRYIKVCWKCLLHRLVYRAGWIVIRKVLKTRIGGVPPGWWAATVATYCQAGWWNIPNPSQQNPVYEDMGRPVQQI